MIELPFVKASGKSPKHEARDAEGIGEAVTRPAMRVVPSKPLEPQDLQALHRVRERLIKARTALVRDIRGLLSGSGMVLRQGITTCRPWAVSTRQDEQTKLTGLSMEGFWHLHGACLSLEERLPYDDEQLAPVGQAHPACQRLQIMPGIGPISATAVLAAVPYATHVINARQLAAWLGLVPREHSTGGKPQLLGISIRGDGCLREPCVHGAPATLRWVDAKPDDRSRWLTALIARRGKNRAPGAAPATLRTAVHDIPCSRPNLSSAWDEDFC